MVLFLLLVKLWWLSKQRFHDLFIFTVYSCRFLLLHNVIERSSHRWWWRALLLNLCAYPYSRLRSLPPKHFFRVLELQLSLWKVMNKLLGWAFRSIHLRHDCHWWNRPLLVILSKVFLRRIRVQAWLTKLCWQCSVQGVSAWWSFVKWSNKWCRMLLDARFWTHIEKRRPIHLIFHEDCWCIGRLYKVNK